MRISNTNRSTPTRVSPCTGKARVEIEGPQPLGGKQVTGVSYVLTVNALQRVVFGGL